MAISHAFARTAAHLSFAGTAVWYAYERIAVPHMLKEMLAIETTITSANSWNSCFHQNSGDSGSPCFARTAVHLNLLGQWSRVLMSEQQFPIFYTEMLTIETAVSSANL